MRNDKCPICHQTFKSNLCPHSTYEVDEYNKQDKLTGHIRKIIKQELIKYDLIKKTVFLAKIDPERNKEG